MINHGVLEKQSGTLAKGGDDLNFSIDVLKNDIVFIKKEFLESEKKFLIEEIEDYTNYSNGMKDRKNDDWYQRHASKLKENFVFTSISADDSKKLFEGNDLSTNIKYYKKYLKLFQKFSSKNFDHLQILRMNYLLKRSEEGGNSFEVPGKESTNVLAKIKNFSSQFEKFLFNFSPPESSDVSVSHGTSLNLISSTIASIIVEDINYDALLKKLQKFTQEALPSIINSDYFSKEISFESIFSIQNNLHYLVDVIRDKYFLKTESFNKNYHREIILSLLSILENFKSQNLFMKILSLIKDHSDNLQFSMNDLKFIKEKIFSIENIVMKIFSSKNSEAESTQTIKLQKVPQITENFPIYFHEVFNIIKVISDDKFYYIFDNNLIIKIKQMNEEISGDNVNQVDRIAHLANPLADNTSIILVGDYFYGYYLKDEKLIHFILDKTKLQIIREEIFIENEKIIYLNIFNDDNYFYIVCRDKFEKKTTDITQDENKIKVIAIKAGYLLRECIGACLDTAKEVCLDILDDKRADFLGVLTARQGVTSYFNFYDQIILFCIDNNSSKFICNLVFEANHTIKISAKFLSCTHTERFHYYNKDINVLSYVSNIAKDDLSLILSISKRTVNNENTYQNDRIKSTDKFKDIQVHVENSSEIIVKDDLKIVKPNYEEQHSFSAEEFHKLLLQEYLDYMHKTCKSSIFKLTNTQTPLIRLYTPPFSFAFDIGVEMVMAIGQHFNNINQLLVKEQSDSISIDDSLFNSESFTFVLLLHNYVKALLLLGIGIEEYTDKIFEHCIKDRSMSLGKIFSIILILLQRINLTKVTSDLLVPLHDAFFIEIVEILEITAKYTNCSKNLLGFSSNFEFIKKIITECSNNEYKAKLFLLIIENNSEMKMNQDEVLQLSKDIMDLQRQVLIDSKRDTISKIEEIYAPLATKFKKFFLNFFSKDFNQFMKSPLTAEKEINNKSHLINTLLNLFTKESNELINVLLALSSSEKLDTNHSIFLYNILDQHSISLNICFFLVQLTTAFLLNKKEEIKAFPHDYLNSVINLYINLAKLNKILVSTNLSKKTTEKNLFHYETVHPASEETDTREEFKFPGTDASTSYARQTWIEFDIFSEFNSAKVSLNTNDCEEMSNSNKTILYSPIKLKQKDLNIKIQIDKSNIIDADKDANNVKKYFSDYGVSFEVTSREVVNPLSRESLLNHQLNQGDSIHILIHLKRSILYLINKIIAMNLIAKQKEITTKERTNSNKDNLLYKSVFNSKLFKNLSLPFDSDLTISRENINHINGIIKEIADERIREQIGNLFIDNTAESCESMEDDMILRTYSTEFTHSRKLNSELATRIGSIVNINDPIYYKGIKYLQKHLKKKNGYLANLTGDLIEPVIINLFAIILKYCNLVNLYVDKYISEIFLLESQLNSENSLSSELKSEDLHKIECFDLLLRIWAECSKIRIWFMEAKMKIAESLKVSKLTTTEYDIEYDSNVSEFVNNLLNKAKFFLSIINENKHNTYTPTANCFPQDVIDNLLLCIKTEEINLEKIRIKINNQNQLGIRRETGLILVNIMLNLIMDADESDLNDLLYNLNKAVRAGDNKIICLIDELEGADYSVVERVKWQFHLLIKNLMRKISQEGKNYSFMTNIVIMQGFIWKILSRDYEIMKDLNIFEAFKEIILNKINNLEGIGEEFGKSQENKFSMSYDYTNRVSLFTVFNELVEIYALQIFRKIKEFKRMNHASSNSRLANDTSLNLTRSYSNVNETEAFEMIMFVLNICEETFEKFLLDKPNKNSNFLTKNTKDYLLLLSKCIGHDLSILQMINSLNPKLFALLLRLLFDSNTNLELKFIISKLISQSIDGLFIISYEDKSQLKILNYSLAKFFQSSTFKKMSLCNKEKYMDSIGDNICKDMNNRSKQRSFVEFLFEVIHSIITSNYVPDEQYTFIYKLRDLFRMLIGKPNKDLSSDVNNVISDKIKDFSRLNTTLFILGIDVDKLRVNSPVYICKDALKVPDKLYLESKGTNNELNGFLDNLNRGSVIGFPLGIVENPFECNDLSRFSSPKIEYCLNETIANHKAFVLLDDGLTAATMKNCSYKILLENVENLIVDSRIDNCLGKSKIFHELNKFIIENSLIPAALKSLIEHNYSKSNYLLLKFIYNVLNDIELSEHLFVLLNNDIDLADKFLTIIVNYSIVYEGSVVTSLNNLEITPRFTSLEFLEEEMHKEIISCDLKPNYNYDGDNTEILSNSEEFFKQFAYTLTFDNKFQIIKNKKAICFKVEKITKINEELDTEEEISSNLLSLLLLDNATGTGSGSAEDIIINSILFIESDVIRSESAFAKLKELTSIKELKCLIIESDLHPTLIETLATAFDLPCYLIHPEHFSQILSYCMFAKTDTSKFDFFHSDLIENMVKEEDKLSRISSDDQLDLFFFADEDAEQDQPDKKNNPIQEEKSQEEFALDDLFAQNETESKKKTLFDFSNRDTVLINNSIKVNEMQVGVLYNRLNCLISRRILFKILSVKFQLNFLLKKISYEQIFDILKTFLLEYFFNLKNYKYLVGNLELSTLISEFLLSLDETGNDTVINEHSNFPHNEMSEYFFNRLLIINSLQINKLSNKSTLIDKFKNKFATTENKLLKEKVLLEAEMLRFSAFLISYRFNSLSQSTKQKLLLNVFCTDKEKNPALSPNSQVYKSYAFDLIRCVMRKTKENILEGDKELLKYFISKNDKEILSNFNKIFSDDWVDSWKVKSTNLQKCDFKNKSSELKIEADYLSIIFSYFDLVIHLLCVYGFNDKVSERLNNNKWFYDIYCSYSLMMNKFKYSNRDYLSFLTLFLVTNKEEFEAVNKLEYHIVENDYEHEFNASEKNFSPVGILKSLRDFDVNWKYESYLVKIKIDYTHSIEKNSLINAPTIKFITIVDENFKFIDLMSNCDDDILLNNKCLASNFNSLEKDKSVNLFESEASSAPVNFSLYGFGKNDSHCISPESDDSYSPANPHLINLEKDIKIKSFKFGYQHTFVLDYFGNLYVAGTGEASGLAEGETSETFTDKNSFHTIGLKEKGIKNVYVSNYNTTIILTNENKLYGCGLNSAGNLSRPLEFEKTSIPFELKPLPVDKNILIKHVAVGMYNTIVILEDGSAFTIGDNSKYQTGYLDSTEAVTDWFQLTLPGKSKKVLYSSAGEFYFLLLIENSKGKVKLYSIGDHEEGRSGVGNDKSRKLRKCAGVEKIEFKYVTTRSKSAAAISKDGLLYTWGDNTNYVLGRETVGTANTPGLVKYFSENSMIVEDVSLCSNHMLVVAKKFDAKGEVIRGVFTCGLIEDVQNGLEITKTITVPYEIEFFKPSLLTKTPIPLKVFASKFQSYVLTVDINDKIIKSCLIGTKCACGKSSTEKIINFGNNSDETKAFCKECGDNASPLIKDTLEIVYSVNNKIDKSDLENIQKSAIALKEVKRILDLDSNEDFSIINCIDCGKVLGSKNENVFVSTENLDLVLCGNCVSDNSLKIKYRQIFYNIRNFNLKKFKLDKLPLQNLSLILKREGLEIEGVKKESKSIYRISVEYKEKYDSYIRKVYQNEIIKSYYDIMTKINSQVLIEYSELTEEYTDNMNSTKELSVKNILNYLNEKQEKNTYILLRGIQTSKNFKFAFRLIHTLLEKINISYLTLLKYNDAIIEETIFCQCIRENSQFISKKNRINLFYKKLAELAKSKPGHNKTKITLNRFKARKFYEKNIPDSTFEETLFGQLAKIMENFDVKFYVCKKDQRLFVVTLIGEGASDSGGPYRDVFSQICEELHSNSLDLFVKTPNNKFELGGMRDRWIPNPAASLSIHKSMYIFIGYLFGSAICSGNLLNLSIHPIVWKLLLDIEVKFSDYEHVDKMFYKLITDLDHVACADNMSTMEFESIYDLTFTTVLSNGQEVSLVEGGKETQVTLKNLKEYIALVKQYRLNEFANQIKYLKDGFRQVIPENLSQFFTWKDLEELVCGKPTIDIEILKQNTSYENIDENENVITWLWEVLRSFTEEEKVLYLKFVWGRSRLPNPELFSYTHIIESDYGDNHDNKFPSAGTCFFTLTLPLYSTKELLVTRLRYAIYNCNEIDADFEAENVDEI